MTGWIVVLLVLVVLAVIGAVAGRRTRAREAEQREQQLAPVRRLAFEDVTALGEELQELDLELAGRRLDEGERADYQRALDAYEAAKTSADAIAAPDDLREVTKVLDDGRYAAACVRARVSGEPLPTRRPPCFFDPRHGLSVTDVAYRPDGGAEREVPACALDAERVAAGADPDVRQVQLGAKRRPYWDAGPAVEPYAAGYFASSMVMNAVFAGLLISAMSPGLDGMDGFDGGFDGGDGGGFDGGGFDAGGFDGGGFDGGF
jgi:uncharacterized membrane protein